MTISQLPQVLFPSRYSSTVLPPSRYSSAAHPLRFSRAKGGTFNFRVSLSHRPEGKILGIAGMHGIEESALVRRAKAFDMRVLYYNRQMKAWLSRKKKDIVTEYLSCLVELLDLMSFSVPVETVTNKHLIFSDSAFFRHDETSAVLMMTARVRGPSIVDEAALVRPLQFDKVTGFGLEVYDDEAKHFPRVSSDHPCTFCLPQVKTVTS